MNTQVKNLIAVLEDGDEWDAPKAAAKLGQIQAKEAVLALIDALHSKDTLELWNALDEMTKVYFCGAGEGIFAIEALRRAAAEALGEIGEKKAIPELLTVFHSNDPDNLEIHDAVAKALAKFGNE